MRERGGQADRQADTERDRQTNNWKWRTLILNTSSIRFIWRGTNRQTETERDKELELENFNTHL